MQKSTNNNTNNGTAVAHPACASCKHQRKKCGEDCILAPYFPAERSQEFQAVHKVFGVSNVMKLVRSVKEEDRNSVADSLVWEAFCRQKDPISGPLGEYKKIQEELALYKSQILNQNQNQLVQQQGNMMYKSASGLINAWNNGSNGMNNKGVVVGGGLIANNNNNNNNNSIVNFSSHDNGSLIVDSIPYSSYPLNYVQGSEKIRKQQDKDVASCLVTLQSHSQHQQQHSITTATGFNQQQYYLPGQFGSVNGKTMDSTLWEGGP